MPAIPSLKIKYKNGFGISDPGTVESFYFSNCNHNRTVGRIVEVSVSHSEKQKPFERVAFSDPLSNLKTLCSSASWLLLPSSHLCHNVCWNIHEIALFKMLFRQGSRPMSMWSSYMLETHSPLDDTYSLDGSEACLALRNDPVVV